MKAPAWYDAWCEEAFAAFTAKQKQLAETFQLESWQRYDYDTRAGTLTFSDANGPRILADIQVVGSIDDDDWRWGWSNEVWPPASTNGMQALRAFGAEHEIEELTTEYLESDDLDGLGWMLVAIAARVLEAEGGYRAPVQAGHIYFLIRSIKFVS
jgi:hypothetical protein